MSKKIREEDPIDQEVIKLVKEAMISGISKEEFKNYIERKKLENGKRYHI